MISLVKPKGTPLADGMYLIHKGLYQIRLKDTQEVVSASVTFEEAVERGKNLVKKYKTLENLRNLLQECDYTPKPTELTSIRREQEEKVAVDKELNLTFNKAITSVIVENEVKKRPRKLRLV